MWVGLLIVFVILLKAKNSKEISHNSTVARGILTTVLLVWCVMSLAGESEFLYFGF